MTTRDPDNLPDPTLTVRNLTWHGNAHRWRWRCDECAALGHAVNYADADDAHRRHVESEHREPVAKVERVTDVWGWEDGMWRWTCPTCVNSDHRAPLRGPTEYDKAKAERGARLHDAAAHYPDELAQALQPPAEAAHIAAEAVTVTATDWKRITDALNPAATITAIGGADVTPPVLVGDIPPATVITHSAGSVWRWECTECGTWGATAGGFGAAVKHAIAHDEAQHLEHEPEHAATISRVWRWACDCGAYGEGDTYRQAADEAREHEHTHNTKGNT